ncbi:hypothetical protein C8R45DRAFT_935867 [Mycena sanguinolenta]|nr:hypothetical protein C8R45DRAFT_935867 [Mycena sanguinolenta]
MDPISELGRSKDDEKKTYKCEGDGAAGATPYTRGVVQMLRGAGGSPCLMRPWDAKADRMDQPLQSVDISEFFLRTQNECSCVRVSLGLHGERWQPYRGVLVGAQLDRLCLGDLAGRDHLGEGCQKSQVNSEPVDHDVKDEMTGRNRRSLLAGSESLTTECYSHTAVVNYLDTGPTKVPVKQSAWRVLLWLMLEVTRAIRGLCETRVVPTKDQGIHAPVKGIQFPVWGWGNECEKGQWMSSGISGTENSFTDFLHERVPT